LEKTSRGFAWSTSTPEGGLIGCVAFLTQEHPMPLRCAAFAEKRRYKVNGGAGIFASHEVRPIEARKGYVHAALAKIKSGQLPFLG
jgi:hypothetical protein